MPTPTRDPIAYTPSTLAKAIDRSPDYVRALIKKGLLWAKPVGDGKATRYIIPVAAWEAFLGGWTYRP